MPEKTSITIEIKKEVSIIFLWLAGGISFVTIAFFLPPQTNELWPQFYSAGIAAIIYLIALLVYVLRKPISAKARIITAICSFLVLGSAVFASIEADMQSHWQQNKLLEIRGLIGREIMASQMPKQLLETLKIYYQQKQKESESLAQIFRRTNAGATVGSNIYTPAYPGDSLKIIVQTLEPERVVLVSQETFIQGRDSLFGNYNGQKGMIQEKCTLTKLGVKYESEN